MEAAPLPCGVTGVWFRVRTDPGKSWNFIVQNARLWKVLENGIGPGNFWKVLV